MLPAIVGECNVQVLCLIGSQLALLLLVVLQDLAYGCLIEMENPVVPVLVLPVGIGPNLLSTKCNLGTQRLPLHANGIAIASCVTPVALIYPKIGSR